MIYAFDAPEFILDIIQEAEANAAAAEEKERSISERLTQTLSRINVLEAQVFTLILDLSRLAIYLEDQLMVEEFCRYHALELSRHS